MPSSLARLLLILTLAMSGLGAAAVPAGAAVPPDFIGMYSEDIAAGESEYRAATLRTQAEIGIQIIRQPFSWSWIEPRRGQYDFTFPDRFVGEAAARGIRVMPVLIDPPSFRSSAPTSGAQRGHYPPARYEDLGEFGATLARRYGNNGTFWTEHPELPRLPIRSWQVWNEPNLPVYWRPRPNARQYVRLLRAAAVGIKSADPGAEIVTAGLPNSRLGIPLERYVTQMYRARAASAFDTLAINPYHRKAAGMIAMVERMRKLMDSRRDRSGHLWVTEYGWSDVGPRSAFRAGPSGQARNIKSALLGLARKRRRLRLRGAILYAWRDGRPYGVGDFWGLHTGLLRIDGSPKPAFHAFRDAARRLR